MMNHGKDRTFKAPCTFDPSDGLGPCPALAVATLADLGLTDQEIATYFRILPDRVARLRLKVASDPCPACGREAGGTPDLDRA